MNFLVAAQSYASRGWLPIPLGLDGQGFPKRPLPKNWPNLDLIEALALPQWADCAGLGIVLGKASNGLAVIDIDDPELAEAAFALCAHIRCVRTVRRRAHIYVVEEAPSQSTASVVQWHGRQIKFELKAQRTQVAAPPTPGYEVVHDVPPKRVPNILAAWEGLADRLGVVMEVQSAGYPPPWQEHVGDGERNQSAYVEAHRLREAGLPLPQALAFMEHRWLTYYQAGGQDWLEIERTVQSAYKKGEVRLITTGVRGLR